MKTKFKSAIAAGEALAKPDHVLKNPHVTISNSGEIYLRLRKRARYCSTKSFKPLAMVDYDARGRAIGIEILGLPPVHRYTNLGVAATPKVNDSRCDSTG